MRNRKKGIFLFVLFASLAMFAFSAAAENNVLVLPVSLTEIRQETFFADTSLGEVVLPKGILSIGSKAFANSSVKKIYLPSSLTYIADDAFAGCTNLTATGETKTYAYDYCQAHRIKFETASSPDDFVFSFTSDTEATLVSWKGEGNVAVVPDRADAKHRVTAIGDHVFESKTHLVSITLPDTVVQIGERAFWGCSALTSIHLPRDLEIIGSEAFAFCEKLKTVEFNQKLKLIYGGAFGWCESLEAANLPDSVEQFVPVSSGSGVFTNCTSLRIFHYPKGLKSVIETGAIFGEYHFHGCTSLTDIVIPEGVTVIPAHMFDDYEDGGNAITTVTLPSTLERIETHAFSRCTNLKEIRIPESVTFIAEEVFWHAYGLEKIYIPATLDVSEYYPWILPPHWYHDSGYPIGEVWTEYGASVITHAEHWKIPYYYLSLTDQKLPDGELERGKHFTASGLIKSNEKITSVQATIKNEAGAQVASSRSKPGTTEFSISGKISCDLHFDQLPEGKYTFALMAETSKSSVTLATSTFTVVAPIPGVRLTGFNFYLAYTEEEGVDLPLEGLITADFVMSKLTVTVTEKDHPNEPIIYNRDIQSDTYNLKNSGINFTNLKPGDFFIVITVEANGKTYECGKGELIIPKKVVIDYDKVDQNLLNEFLSDPLNKEYFPRNMYKVGNMKIKVVDGVSGEDGFLLKTSMFLSNFDDFAKSIIKDLALYSNTGIKRKSFFIDLAKGQIKSFVSSINDNEFTNYGYDPEKVESLIDVFLQSALNLNESIAKSALASKPWAVVIFDLYREAARELEFYDHIHNCEALRDLVRLILTDYVKGMAVLDWLDTHCSYSGEYGQYYHDAVEDLRLSYQGHITSLLYNGMKIAEDKVAEKGVEALLNLALSAFGEGADYGIVTFFLSDLPKMAHVYDDADAFVDYLLAVDFYFVAEKSFEGDFAKASALISQGTDPEAIAAAKEAVVTTFDFALSRAKDTLDRLEEMKRLDYSFMKDISRSELDELGMLLYGSSACPFRK